MTLCNESNRQQFEPFCRFKLLKGRVAIHRHKATCFWEDLGSLSRGFASLVSVFS